MVQPQVLIIAEPAQAQQALATLGQQARQAKPYEALEALAQQDWAAVLLWSGQDDLPGLARACRKLHRRASLVALCPPAAEPQIRRMVGPVLDDYLIDPPTRGDLSRLLGRTAPPAAVVQAKPALSGEELSALIRSASDRRHLEQAVQSLLASRLSIELGWADASDRADQGALLRLQEPPARVLVGSSPVPADSQPLVDAVAQVLGALEQAAVRTASLHRLAVTDHLTGAYNRRYFYQVTDQILQRASKRNLRATLLLYDIDDFKSYNDRFGHAVGDEILRETAALMNQITRGHDIVARIGGDEFAVLFWDAEEPRVPGSRPPESAYILANRFLQAVGTHEFPSLGPNAVGLLTISGGLANFPADGATCRELLRSADLALDAVKRSGKNAIRLIGPH